VRRALCALPDSHNHYGRVTVLESRSETPYWDGSRLGNRTCYYTFKTNGRNIKFGQYTQFLTEKEYRVLLSKARAKDWQIFKPTKPRSAIIF
jgi:hypothetical protein